MAHDDGRRNIMIYWRLRHHQDKTQSFRPSAPIEQRRSRIRYKIQSRIGMHCAERYAGGCFSLCINWCWCIVITQPSTKACDINLKNGSSSISGDFLGKRLGTAVRYAYPMHEAPGGQTALAQSTQGAC